MSDTKLERRMADLEKELATLRTKVESIASAQPWWEQIAGTFQGDNAYRQAMKLGKQYRRAQKPNGS